MRKATLVLNNGLRFEGQSFGYEGGARGEVVFNTAMMGYPESLTDPSYAGQILVLTFPLVGNYGVPPHTTTDRWGPALSEFMESDRIHVRGLVVSDYSEQFSHWNATESLGDWLKREHIPAITGIDTRELTKRLREEGVMLGSIEVEGCDAADATGDAQYEGVNFVEKVSCKEVLTYNRGGAKRVVLVDCGVKNNILRLLLERGVELVRVPWDYDFNALDFDGLFLANGPGDPTTCAKTVDHLRRFFAREDAKPCMGICMGNQLLGQAAGARIYKLKYGHRSHNQPVREVGTDNCFITSQNHGYAIDATTLPTGWAPMFENMNDGSNEGLRHRSKPWFSAQFHPEAAGGPLDTTFIFDRFVELLK